LDLELHLQHSAKSIEDNGGHFDGNAFGMYITYDDNVIRSSPKNPFRLVENVNVTGTTFNNNLQKGIYAED
jgi:hypothetical protein